jgi:cohesin loading factor subunit SCC2
MKSLSNILNNAKKENATALLARSDLQRAMKSALLDASTSVREATIDLIGKFILSAQSEELVDKYYDIISDRVLDTGVSVRKRVIKILRDICLAFPSYRKVPDICAKIIKRVNDDGEGIRKLVTETFTSMWFKEERDRESVLLKVKSINHVVATVLSDKVGTEWLQQLLQNLFVAQNDQNKKKTVTELALEEEDDSKTTLSEQQLQQVTSASSQIIEVLVSEILCGDSSNTNAAQSKSDILSAITTIWLFSKVCPHLLLNHISTLHPYLSTKCTTQLDIMLLSKVVQIIELVLPKLSDPPATLLTKIEEDLTKNIVQSNATVVGACVSCLSAVIHKHTGNQALANDLFKMFFGVLDSVTRTLSSDPDYLRQPNVRPRLLRALFTCGLFVKHFSFLQQKQQLYHLLVSFVRQNQATESRPHARDSDVLLKALTGLGFMFERNPEYSLKPETTELYRSMLRCAFGSEEYREMVQCQVLKNMTNYLSDEFNSEMNNTINWSKENLKSMSSEDGDANSQQSSIIQCYLPDILNCTLSSIIAVRRAAVNVIHIIHNGGHVHPLQLVPYLIAMSSDDDVNIRFRSDHVLNEIERKYHGYVSMKSKVGVHLSYQLHSHSGRRGYRIENVNQSASTSSATPNATPAAEEKLVTGRLATLYAVVANNRQSRRAFIAGLLKYFDMIGDAAASGFNDVMTSISIGHESMDDQDQVLLQQFVCDNIVWLPYTLWDEPLYILTQLELNLSILASNIQSQFKNILSLTDDDEDALDAKDDTTKADGPQPVESENPQNQDSNPSDEAPRNESDLSFISDLKSYIPKPMPSFTAVADLVKVLRAYYMLMWCKHIMRELFAINDLKVQDYSPNENPKIWEKVVHRRVVSVASSSRMTLFSSFLFLCYRLTIAWLTSSCLIRRF